MKIAIIGAGIYGCHLALSLRKQGHEIDLYDMAGDLFSGASTYNSCRIHKGYHYPRSSKTREMCKRDEIEFIAHYPHLVSDGKNNPKIFCVANDEKTLIDFHTMKLIMMGSGLPFEELSLEELKKLGFLNVEGGFVTYEPVFLVDKAKKWFKEELHKNGVNLKMNFHLKNFCNKDPHKVKIDDFEYDFILNCTYNQAFSYAPLNHHCYFDLCFYLIVASKNKKDFNKNYYSFGIFDGEYPSFEPFGYERIPEKYMQYLDRVLFQLFHVKYTSIKKYTDIKAARDVIKKGLSSEEVQYFTNHIVKDVLKFYPGFNENFEIIDYRLAIKTKVSSLSDERPLLVSKDSSRHPRFIQIFSSKLSSIFSAEQEINNLLSKHTLHHFLREERICNA